MVNGSPSKALDRPSAGIGSHEDTVGTVARKTSAMPLGVKPGRAGEEV